MDAEAIKLLGSGNAQLVLAAGVFVFATFGVWALRELLKSYDARLVDKVAMLEQQSKDTKLMTDAMRDMKSAIDLLTASVLKGRA